MGERERDACQKDIYRRLLYSGISLLPETTPLSLRRALNTPQVRAQTGCPVRKSEAFLALPGCDAVWTGRILLPLILRWKTVILMFTATSHKEYIFLLLVIFSCQH